MSDVSTLNPHKEEDLGYLAAEAGAGIDDNPYPPGTIRYKDWRCGWQMKIAEGERRQTPGYLAAKAGLGLEANPHPRGTIRYDEWRRDWQVMNNASQRAARLGTPQTA